MENILKKIVEIPGVSGFEQKISLEIKNMIEKLCDEVSIDKMHNVIAIKKSKSENAKTLLIDAHIDQIGFIVTQVLKVGFLRFTNIGGVDPRMLLGQQVLILAEKPIRGIICCTPPHLGNDKIVDIKDMIIDVGIKNPDIKIGTAIIFADENYSLNDKSITGKCIDDRAGCAVILKLADEIKNIEFDFNIVYMFSTTEEINGRGSIVGTYKIKPDFAIAIDVTHGKTPDAPSDKTFEMGAGVLIGMGPNLHRNYAKKLIKTAKAYDILFGLEIMEGSTGTNAWGMQIVASGVPMALLSIPLRYMHTAIETIYYDDLYSTYNLIYNFLMEGNIFD